MPPNELLEISTTYRCKPCGKTFPTWQHLHNHKDELRSAGLPKHIHCKICSADFKTEIAEIKHIQLNHPKEQNLTCPGCGHGPFVRLGGLIQHIEKECHVIDNADLEEMREAKLEFSTKLANMTGEPVKSNYAHCFPHMKPPSTGGAWVIPHKPDPVVLKENEFPGLPGQLSRKPNTTNESEVKSGTSSTWNSGKKPFPNAPPAQRPTPKQLQTATVAAPNSKTFHRFMDLDHPDHPEFNVARYYVTYSEKFSCPKDYCTKVFKNANGIIGHLKSPAHSGEKYTCPVCLRNFTALSAITQHVESNGTFCKIRETDDYDPYLNQLTAGLVDIDIENLNDDGTLKYRTTENARELIMEAKSRTSMTTRSVREVDSICEEPKALDTGKVASPDFGW
ncbi:hypothetical protein G7046_g7555 [Stylonectria norvegica]|nr:hypothetical protein G7046_g7555 [Stylonectria norvegica]